MFKRRNCLVHHVKLIFRLVAEYVSPENEHSAVTQEVVSQEVCTLNHSVMNKRQEDQVHFSQEKKKDSSLVDSSHRFMDLVSYKIIDSSIIQDIFSSVLKCLCNREKQS